MRQQLVAVLGGIAIGVMLAALLLLVGCSELRPTQEPVQRAHWRIVRWDGAHRRMLAVAVNSSTVPVVIECMDVRVTVPPRMELDVLIFDGQMCDLVPEETVPNQ